MSRLRSVEQVTINNQWGRNVPGIQVTCPACGDTAHCFGTRGRSVRRAMDLLKETCNCEETATTMISTRARLTPESLLPGSARKPLRDLTIGDFDVPEAIDRYADRIDYDPGTGFIKELRAPKTKRAGRPKAQPQHHE